MVTKEKFQGEETFACGECGMHYREKTDAEECEDFCREKGICNTEIIDRSVERSG